MVLAGVVVVVVVVVFPKELTIVSMPASLSRCCQHHFSALFSLLRPFDVGGCGVVVTVDAAAAASTGRGAECSYEASRAPSSYNTAPTTTETFAIHRPADAATVARTCPRVTSEQNTSHGSDFHLLAGACKRLRS
uniref:Secreted protein n=1 Tax=Anopheles coluzzii TaxID=1518534 RepID=A0A8W7PGW9_ANOCL